MRPCMGLPLTHWRHSRRWQGLGLLSQKPIIYAANVADGDLADGNEMVERVRSQSHTAPDPPCCWRAMTTNHNKTKGR